MIKSKLALNHYRNEKITGFLESIESQEGKDGACRMLAFIKEEYPEVAQPLYGDLIWSETKEGIWPQQ